MPQGTVTFFNGVNAIGSMALNSSGVATLTTTTLPVGSDSITATFAATADFIASTSAGTMVTISLTPLPQLIPYLLSTAAGTPGTSSYLGDNGPATSATIKSPQGLVLDAAGNIYISDTWKPGDPEGDRRHRVRIITPAGIISVVAGYPPQTSNAAGTAGFGGDGVSATSSTVLLNSPSGATV